MIKIENLHHSFGEKNILVNLDLTVECGTIHSLIGVTGAGKTLLLKIISQLVAIQKGSVNIPEKKLAYVFQQNSLFPWLNVLKNLELATGKDSREIQNLLEKFRLQEFLYQYPRDLSGGTIQKINLLRSFISGAEIILMDEPFSHLDIIQREVLYDFTLELWRSSKSTLLLVTHDIDEALLLSKNVSFLSKAQKTIVKNIEVRPDQKASTLPELRNNPYYQSLYQELHSLLKKDLA